MCPNPQARCVRIVGCSKGEALAVENKVVESGGAVVMRDWAWMGQRAQRESAVDLAWRAFFQRKRRNAAVRAR